MATTHEPDDLADLIARSNHRLGLDPKPPDLRRRSLEELARPRLDRPGRSRAPGTARTVRVAIHLTPAEARDWRRIAAGWDVALPVALWAVTSTQLARWRRRAPDLGRNGLAIAAGLWTLGSMPGRPRRGASGGD